MMNGTVMGPAARVERHGNKARVDYRDRNRQRKHYAVEENKRVGKRNFERGSHKRQHHEYAYAHSHREYYRHIGYARQLRGEHGKVGLGNRDKHAEDKAQKHGDKLVPRLRHRRAYAVAHGHHRHVHAQGEQRHAQNEQQRAEHE